MILLLATFVWGWYGYQKMPKRKDPDIPVRVAAAQCQWPGATAEQVEQLVTRPMEQAAAQNTTIRPPSPSNFGIRSISFPGLAVVYIQLADNVKDKSKEFSDINLKMNQLNAQLPRGAGPIQFNSNFGDTAALMLTVASPKVTPTEVALRAIAIRKAIEAHTRRAAQGLAATASQRHLRVSAFRRAGAGAQQFRNHRQHRPPQRHAEGPAFLRRPRLRRPRCQHQPGRGDHSPARRTAHPKQPSPL